MHFCVVWVAAILALVGAGEAAAIAPRGEGGGYRCNGCSGNGLNVICLDCSAIDISILDGII